MLLSIGLPILGYLSGSLASAVIVCRLVGLPDPRSGGSGNPGATNVLRLGGKRAAAMTLLGDVLKGVLPVVAAHLLGVPAWSLALTALGAVLGHLFPIFFGFKGGKGVATAGGAVVALAWPVGLLLIATWLLVASLTRYSSAASLVASLSAPLIAWALGAPVPIIVVLALIAALIIWRHKGNIARLRDGTESRIGDKSGKPDPSA